MKILKRISHYIIFLMLGIFVAVLYNFFSNKNINNTKNIQVSSITRDTENVGTKYSISSNNKKNSNAGGLTINDDFTEFYLNIDNFDNFDKKNNIITVFINNIQVKFDFNDKKNNEKYTFDLEPKNNCFKIKINNENVNRKENDLLLIISRKCANYDVMSSYEERQSNSTNFVKFKLFNYNVKNDDDNKKEYQCYDSEKDIKMNNGIYLNKLLNDDKIDNNPIMKAKVNEKINIPVVIKNNSDYDEANIIFLVNDEQYKVDNKDYIDIKLNNSLAKLKFFCIKSPNQKGNYEIKVAMNCKNEKNQTHLISNTINLIVE